MVCDIITIELSETISQDYVGSESKERVYKQIVDRKGYSKQTRIQTVSEPADIRYVRAGKAKRSLIAKLRIISPDVKYSHQIISLQASTKRVASAKEARVIAFVRPYDPGWCGDHVSVTKALTTYEFVTPGGFSVGMLDVRAAEELKTVMYQFLYIVCDRYDKKHVKQEELYLLLLDALSQVSYEELV